MKLLSKKDLNKERQKQADHEVSLAVKKAEFIFKQNQQLNHFKGGKDKEMENINKVFYDFVNEKAAQRKILLNEIATLEERKRAALKPIEKIQKEATEMLYQTQEKASKLMGIQEAQDIRETFLFKHKNDLKKREKRVELAEKQLEIQKYDMKIDTKYLREQEVFNDTIYDKYVEKKASDNAELDQERHLLKEKNASLDIARRTYDENMVKLVGKEKFIKDQRALLDRGFAELKRKQNGTST